MTDMIERVAIAISNAMEASLPKFTQQNWDQLSMPAKASYRARARAAIEAMREPTDAMLQVGAQVSIPGDSGSHDAGPFAHDIWRGMINAALK